MKSAKQTQIFEEATPDGLTKGRRNGERAVGRQPVMACQDNLEFMRGLPDQHMKRLMKS